MFKFELNKKVKIDESDNGTIVSRADYSQEHFKNNPKNQYLIRYEKKGEKFEIWASENEIEAPIQDN